MRSSGKGTWDQRSASSENRGGAGGGIQGFPAQERLDCPAASAGKPPGGDGRRGEGASGGIVSPAEQLGEVGLGVFGTRTTTVFAAKSPSPLGPRGEAAEAAHQVTAGEDVHRPEQVSQDDLAELEFVSGGVHDPQSHQPFSNGLSPPAPFQQDPQPNWITKKAIRLTAAADRGPPSRAGPADFPPGSTGRRSGARPRPMPEGGTPDRPGEIEGDAFRRPEPQSAGGKFRARRWVNGEMPSGWFASGDSAPAPPRMRKRDRTTSSSRPGVILRGVGQDGFVVLGKKPPPVPPDQKARDAGDEREQIGSHRGQALAERLPRAASKSAPRRGEVPPVRRLRWPGFRPSRGQDPAGEGRQSDRRRRSPRQWSPG